MRLGLIGNLVFWFGKLTKKYFCTNNFSSQCLLNLILVEIGGHYDVSKFQKSYHVNELLTAILFNKTNRSNSW